MKKLRDMIKDGIFKKFLISYLLIFIIPLIIGAIAYNEALRLVEQHSKDSSMSVLEQSMAVLDRRLSEVDNMALQLSLNPKISRFTREFNPYIDRTVPCKINEIREELAPLTFTNNFINTLYVFFKKSNVIISPIRSYINLDSFYGDNFQYGNMSYSDWYNEILGGKYVKAYMPEIHVSYRTGYDADTHVNDSMIMFIQSFPLKQLDRGQIIILISKVQFEELLKDVRLKQEGSAYILDSHGEVLISTPATEHNIIDKIDIDTEEPKGFKIEEVDGQKMIIAHTQSSYNGWRYLAVLPYHTVMEKALYIKQIIITVLIITLLMGILCAYLMAYRSSKPIRKIVSTVRDFIGDSPGEKQDEYAMIEGSILDLITQNKELGQRLDRQLPLLKATFIQRLCSGEFKNRQEIEWMSEQLRIKDLQSNILVAIVRIIDHNLDLNVDMLKEMGIMKIILIDELSKHLDTQVYSYDLDFDKSVILLQVQPETTQDYIDMTLKRIWDIVYDGYGVSLFFAVGSLAGDLLDINRSFEEAKEVVDYKVFDKNPKVLWHLQDKKQRLSYYYPVSIEMKLFNCAKAGDWDDIETIINQIYRENFIRRGLPSVMVKYLISEMRGTMIKILYTLSEGYEEMFKSIEDRINGLDDNRHIDEIFSSIFDVYRQICDILNSQVKSKNQEIIDSIRSYIESNYRDAQLSLVSVAEQFGVSGTYFSQLFKDHTGENFSIYLEKRRIQKACDLLAEEMAIKDVAKEVGYNSVYVFRRAFKRVLGINPSEYKVM